MLYWEAERPELGVVHHLAVLCYHLQHPSLYSQEGLLHGIKLLDEFINGVTPAESRKLHSTTVDSGHRTFNITARPDNYGEYPQPISWKMTVTDVIEAGINHYIESVEAWVHAIHADLVQAELLKR